MLHLTHHIRLISLWGKNNRVMVQLKDFVLVRRIIYDAIIDKKRESTVVSDTRRSVQPPRIMRATRALCASVRRTRVTWREQLATCVVVECRREKRDKNERNYIRRADVLLSRGLNRPRKMRLRVFGKSLRLNEQEEKMMSRRSSRGQCQQYNCYFAEYSAVTI